MDLALGKQNAGIRIRVRLVGFEVSGDLPGLSFVLGNGGGERSAAAAVSGPLDKNVVPDQQEITKTCNHPPCQKQSNAQANRQTKAKLALRISLFPLSVRVMAFPCVPTILPVLDAL